jgi:hypothetical protein
MKRMTLGLLSLPIIAVLFLASCIPVTSSQTSSELTSEASVNTGTQINRKTGTYENYYLGLVTTPDGNLLGGDGCYDDQGNFIILINNKDAADPSYAQLVNFLRSDTTDEYPYIGAVITLEPYTLPAESHVDLTRIKNIIDGTEQPTDPFVCSDFAERLHNDAEIAGLRCAYVAIDLSTGGHGIVAFQTTDKGLIYIDDTGPSQSPHPVRSVKTVNLSIGSDFIPVSLFPEKGWKSTYDTIGIVIDMKINWDGDWKN